MVAAEGGSGLDAPAGDAAPPVAGDGGLPPPGDAAISQDAQLPPGTLFADPFDDVTPLPRDWEEVVGPPQIVATALARSTPNVLVAGSKQPHAAKYVRRTVLTPGKTSITCRFAARLIKYSGVNGVEIGFLEVSDGTYVRFDVTDGQWMYYGQQGATEYGDRIVTNTLDRWLDTSLTIEASGKVTVTSAGSTLTKAIAPADTSRFIFYVGFVRPPVAPGEVEVLIDDVSCGAQ